MTYLKYFKILLIIANYEQEFHIFYYIGFISFAKNVTLNKSFTFIFNFKGNR